MLTPRLTECLECADISALLSEIDCKLTDLAKAEYNNLVFSLNRPIQGILISDLLIYKRILINRLCNPDYACTYPLNQIASRVKTLHPIQCKPNCQENDFRFFNPVSNVYPPTTIPPPSTTTTSSSSSTSTSTTSSTTTININDPLQFYYAQPVCLYPANPNAPNACSSACSLAFTNECNVFYVSPLCFENLSVGCILYLDNTYTNQASSYNDVVSDGINCYNVTNGVITNVSSCPVSTSTSTTTSSTTTRYISNCTNVHTVRPNVNVNGNEITATYTGTVCFEGLPGYIGKTICQGNGSLMGENTWLGCSGWAFIEYPFTYTIHFSIPVNNIKLRITAMGTYSDEVFTFTTNVGDPVITTIFSCNASASGNQITGGLNAPVTSQETAGGGEFMFTTNSSYTSLTISGNGISNGALFGIVCSSI